MPEILNLLQLVEQLQQDLRHVVNETKRKYIPVKEAGHFLVLTCIERRNPDKTTQRIG